MPTTQDKIAEYLHEAHAMELALVRTLEAHSAMAPPGSYRDALHQHLRETRDHADRVARRLADLGRSESPLETGKGIAQRVVGQLLALGKTPLDVLRGSSHEEKLLKNAKDECATEALEIATYDALETLARAGGDELTARLAADHRADEERMLETLRAELPRLTAAVVGAQVPPAAARSAPAVSAPPTVRAVPAPRPAPAARKPRPAPRPTTATPASRTAPPAPPSPTAASAPPTESRVAAAATAPPPARRPAPAATAPPPARRPAPAATAPPPARRPVPASRAPPPEARSPPAARAPAPARRAAAARAARRAARRPAAARSPAAGAGAIR